MKRVGNKILKLIALLLGVSLLCGCSPTAFLTDEARADYLFEKSDGFFTSDKSHYSYEVYVDARVAGEEYTQKAIYDELYDGSVSGNEKFAYRERINEFTGVQTEYVYLDEKLYITSETQKVSIPIADINEAFTYPPYYSVYYDVSVPVTIICPEPENGQYTMTQQTDDQRLYSQVYEYAWWAIPSYLYDAMEVKDFYDVHVFNEDGRLERYEAYVEIGAIDPSSDDWFSIDFIQHVLYDDFEITAPEGSESYNFIENYDELDNMIVSTNMLLAEQNGELVSTFIYDLSGAENTCYTITDRLVYSTTKDGLLVYEMISTYEDEEYSESMTSEYDGEKIVTVAQGSRTETPCSQNEAYMAVNLTKDFLWLDRTMVQEILSVESLGGRTVMKLVPTDLFIKGLIQDELQYIEYPADQNSLEIVSATLAVEMITNGGDPVLDAVSLQVEARFDLYGEKTEISYTYEMQVIEHES